MIILFDNIVKKLSQIEEVKHKKNMLEYFFRKMYVPDETKYIRIRFNDFETNKMKNDINGKVLMSDIIEIMEYLSFSVNFIIEVRNLDTQKQWEVMKFFDEHGTNFLNEDIVNVGEEMSLNLNIDRIQNNILESFNDCNEEDCEPYYR